MKCFQKLIPVSWQISLFLLHVRHLCLFHVNLLLFQRARERSRITVNVSGGATPRSPGWSSLMSSVGLYMQYSKRTSARPKSYKSPSLSSWAWSSPLSATSSWTRVDGASISGWMTAAPTRPTPPRPALVPKHDGVVAALWKKKTLRWKSFKQRNLKRDNVRQRLPLELVQYRYL